MTDHFALLEQPRLPWLEPEQLKEAFHRATLRAHPDAAPAGSDGDFAQLNEAYQTLRDPKLRLQHLLTLTDNAPSRNSGAIPRDVEELFPAVATLTQQAAEVADKFANASSSLTRSVLKAQMLQTQQRVSEMLHVLEQRQAESTARLQQLNSAWEANREAVISELHELYLRFSYLSRWAAELRERELQLRG
jgi:curved DNA-binding protein CbpA